MVQNNNQIGIGNAPATRGAPGFRKTQSGILIVDRYSDVVEALKDARLSNRPGPFALLNKRNATRFVAADVASNLIAFQDRPEHLAPRTAMSRAFRVALAEIDPALEEIAKHQMDRLNGRDEIEFLRDFAADYAAICICRLMGLPDDDASRIREWSEPFFYLFHAIPDAEVFNRLNSSLNEFRDYCRAAVEEKSSAPGRDFISRLLEEGEDGYRMPIEAVVDNCMLLAADGVENVQAGLTSSVALLLQHPEELAKLEDSIATGENSDALIRSCINECLRFESPGQYQLRVANAETSIGGKAIRRHSVVALSFAAANRDPEVFENPDRFFIDRKGPRHLAFGYGHHGCLGSALVEREFAAVFLVLFGGSRRYKLRDVEIRWLQRTGHRWPEALNLLVEEA